MVLGNTKADPRLQDALRTLKRWIRERFGLDPDATVMATQLDCGEPGCPPHETVVAFWDAASARHQFKILKSAVNVSRDDVRRLGDPSVYPLCGSPQHDDAGHNTQ